MAYEAFVGSFNIDSAVTAGNDQAITGVGFEPKIVLFWWSGSTATVDSVAGGTIMPGFGAAISSSSRFFATGISDDGVAASDTYCAQDAAYCIGVYADGDGTLDGYADLKSLDADGFTLTIDDQFGSDWRISYLALGGDDLTNVYIGNFVAPGGIGNHNITGVGFQPDAVIFATSLGALYNPSGASTNMRMALGWATASDAQGAVEAYSADGAATSNTSGYGYSGECVSVNACAGREAFVAFGADGFTLNCLEVRAGLYTHYVAIKGGQYAAGDLMTRTDGNDIEENVGFQPVAVMFTSANRALSTQNTPSDHARLSIGAGTSTSERAAQAISDEDALADTETAYTNQDDAVYAHVKDDAIEALMDIKSIDVDGFTCVMDTVEATAACWVTYLAIGAGGCVTTVTVTETATVTVVAQV